jgi:hypothetical protein
VFCKFGKGSRKRKKGKGEEPSSRKKKKKEDENVVYASEDQIEQMEEEDPSPTTLSAYKSVRLMNPLPGFKDPMTNEQVEKPCISPYGHVLGWNTWQKILTKDSVCPFTKQPLQLRDLIKLTFDNIIKYQDLIKNSQ